MRMERAVKDGERDAPRPADARTKGSGPGHYSPSGVFGDATLATWQKGERVVTGVMEDLLKDIDDLARAPLPAGEPKSPLGEAVPR